MSPSALANRKRLYNSRQQAKNGRQGKAKKNAKAEAAAIEKRIKRIVRRVRRQEAQSYGDDVLHDRRSLFRNGGSLRSVKVG